ncbi:F-box/kelch-repeat protein At3g23880-like [Salvia miltiorrhiza]|uniref:F-box/kelch-repeat protein At3g23880-like n=1 Tax=Salvia miltiorrhiza TaxID=226208 RepID=UPI0025ACC434|nr:F-box/kelch-repeat protein At3g23880-like [Salvia miltiorrhiza]
MMEGKRISSDSTAHNQLKKIKIAHLPEEIIQDILLRLPVKSLLKSRCVSKSWNSLISSSRFVNTHLKRSAENADFANHRIIFTLINPSFNLKQCSVNSLMCEPLTVASNVDYPNKTPHSAVWVVGSCNGIICVAIDEKDVFLWNPATRKSKQLPPAGVEMKPGFYYIWGFGYSESEVDYKVVGLFCAYGDGGLQESVVKIYSLRANSWKRIEDFRCGVPFDETGKFASGKLHFAASKGMDFDSRWNIVSLDLKSEAYGIVEQPSYEEGCSDFSLELVGGCLSILCDYEMKRTDLWVLKESWSRLLSIPYLMDPGKYVYSNPLLMMPNGDILLVFGACFVVYNPKDDSFRCPRISNVDSFLEADIYVESLVPL